MKDVYFVEADGKMSVHFVTEKARDTATAMPNIRKMINMYSDADGKEIWSLPITKQQFNMWFVLCLSWGLSIFCVNPYTVNKQ
jgi:hypothetical protein